MDEKYNLDADQDRIESQYILLGGMFIELERKLLVDINYTIFQHSCNALYYGAKKIDNQLSVLFKSDMDDNYYVNNILFRTIFEHFLVAYYIGTRCRAEYKDVGEEYYGAYGQKEYIKRVFKHYDIEALRDGKPKPTDPERIAKFNSQHQHIFHPLTDREKNKIYDVASQFGEDRIIKYLLHEAPDDEFKYFNKSMYAFLNTYNVTSSNIHGGPGAEKEYYKSDDLARTKRLNRLHINLCKYTSFGIKLNLFAILAKDKRMPEYKNIFKPVEQLLRYYKVWP